MRSARARGKARGVTGRRLESQTQARRRGARKNRKLSPPLLLRPRGVLVCLIDALVGLPRRRRGKAAKRSQEEDNQHKSRTHARADATPGAHSILPSSM